MREKEGGGEGGGKRERERAEATFAVNKRIQHA
jgi:hypothetical protein